MRGLHVHNRATSEALFVRLSENLGPICPEHKVQNAHQPWDKINTSESFILFHLSD